MSEMSCYFMKLVGR